MTTAVAGPDLDGASPGRPSLEARAGSARRLHRRVAAAALALAIIGSSCSTSDSDESSQSTVAPTTVSTTAAPTTIPAAPATTTTTEFVVPALAIEVPEPVPIAEIDGWELVWHDEFDGEVIDRTNWTYDVGGWGWGNGEAQYYTTREQNSRLQDGLLVIEARQERFEGSYFTSARMLTQGLREFKYGRFEARIKVPSGAGLWPAFWMLGADFEHNAPDEANRWPFVGEIDIMEYVGREPDLILGTIHGPGYAGAIGITKWFRQDYPIADDFHTYAIEWDESGIRWFYDGVQYQDLTPDIVGNREWVFDHEFFLILNLAVGGHFPGPIALDLEFPVQLYVDYVRVYQRVDGTA